MAENNIEVIHKEIDLIQNCISRMAQNSFLIKGWALTVVTVVLALMEKNIDPRAISDYAPKGNRGAFCRQV